MEALLKERKGEIALALLREKFRREGIRIVLNGMKREIGNFVKATGVSYEDLVAFIEEETRSLLEETFQELKKTKKTRQK